MVAMPRLRPEDGVAHLWQLRKTTEAFAVGPVECPRPWEGPDHTIITDETDNVQIKHF